MKSKKKNSKMRVALFLCLLFVSTWSFSLIVTGDVNLNPNLDSFVIGNYTYVWGDMINILKNADVLAINHESTLAGIKLSDPNVIQFEDPLNYIKTYGPDGVGADFISQANNHQFDFGLQGIKNTITSLSSANLMWGGIGSTQSQVQTPSLVSVGRQRVAFFTAVVDECWRWGNGTLYLDGCTCGSNAGPPPAYQCYSAGDKNTSSFGLWYHFGITPDLIQNMTQVISAYKKQHPDVFVVTYLHVGPNFQWQPYPEHELLLRSIAGVCDLVWGTSSHHIQRFEIAPNGTPIIYGLGDLLFRHVPGVDDFCPLYAIPCEQYRPELALSYQFEIIQTHSGPKVDLTKMLAYPTRHTTEQTFRVQDWNDIDWIENIFNELSSPYGANATYSRDIGAYIISKTA